MPLIDQIGVTELKGVAQKLAERLARLHIHHVQDLLFHLPMRYEDRTQITPINQLMPGTYATIEAEIVSSQLIHARKQMLTCKVQDQTGQLTLRFFHFSAALHRSLGKGLRIRAYGEIKQGHYDLEIIHPEYQTFTHDEVLPLAETLTPVYATTEGLKQNTWLKITEQALELLQQNPLPELLPEKLQHQGLTLSDAIRILHRPPANTDQYLLSGGKHPAQRRLIEEELLAHNLSMLSLRQQSHQHQAIALHTQQTLEQQFLSQLPFTPTNAQQRVVTEIHQDLALPTPMMRLVQGDVGSGKTLVAALAALRALENNYQVALMAPTELLAEQHAKGFSAWLNPLGIEVAWLAGKLKGKARTETLAGISDGSLKMIVGTHAIFQEQVQFKNLALIIIDEQHRFGVGQRLELREKGAFDGNYPHQLIMTATPIPRTLAMTAYADLDTSIIDELPPGRTPITTVAIDSSRRDEVIERVRQAALNDQRQAYWVCTLIDESEVLECQAAEDIAIELTKALPELKIGLVHGRMKAAEKQAVMDAFKTNELNLLVATTVIEVGVDVPNASLMIIENPERLGLAQLHQLRGRVGRGAIASHCVLLYQAPLSATAKQRLGVLRQSNDGFIIAQKDLEIRGPGEVLGLKQTGLAEMKVADLLRDQHLIPHIQQMARQLMSHQPQQVQPIIERWLAHQLQYVQA